MDPTWNLDGDTHDTVHDHRRAGQKGYNAKANHRNAEAGPARPTAMNSRPRTRKRTKAPIPFVSAHHRPDPGQYDGIFRVVIITSGSVASVKLPLIVGELCKNPKIELQVVATQASRHFYSQNQVDEEVRAASGQTGDERTDGEAEGDIGVRIWSDEDEWSDWRKIGDPILHIELRRWADLVVVAPCSADFLAKLAAGLCDNLPLSLLRALPFTTPVILCPAMNTQMYSHPFTSDHLSKLEDRLGYRISGPQGAGKLACGDEGPGKMTDWRDIVEMIESFASVFHLRHSPSSTSTSDIPEGVLPTIPQALNPPISSLRQNSDSQLRFGKGDRTHSRNGHNGDLIASADIEQGSTLRNFTVDSDERDRDRDWERIWPKT